MYVEDDCSADWTKAIDRGDLKVVNDKTYQLFVAMETRLGEFFQLTLAKNISDVHSGQNKNILKDGDVLFFWLLSGNERKLYFS